MGVESYKQKLLLAKTSITAGKLLQMNNHMPNILTTIYNEDREREKDEFGNISTLVKDFGDRQYDLKYHYFLEKKK